MAPTTQTAVPDGPVVDILPNAMDVSRTALVRRARTINRTLHETYPDAHCELDFGNPLELLVATILSAQTTDKRVNLLTPILFARYPTAAAMRRPTGWSWRSCSSRSASSGPSPTRC